MAIDKTFDFGQAVAITHDMVDDFFNSHHAEELDEMNIPTSIGEALADLLNGELDHVVLRHAIEKTLETTTA